MSAWPLSLPQTPALQGFTETERETVIRSPASAGPSLVRRRFTAAISPVTCSTKPLTAAQREILRAWFRDEIKGGALTFTWPKLSEHTGGGAGTFEMVAPPDYAPLGRGYWRASLQVIRLP